MKKSLSLLVAIAMVFSMFATVVSAADTKLTTEQKYEALVAAGIFEGKDDGEAHLDDTMTRAQAAKIVALLAGYEEGVEVKDAGYTDLVGAGWATDFINYATQVGILEGKGNNKFDPSADVTIQQLATIAVKLVKAAGVDLPAGEAVEGDVAAWAAKDVAAAVSAGLLPASDDYTVAALRALLVEVTYSAKAALEAANQPAVSAQVIGAKKIEVKFNKAADKEKIEITVKNNNHEISIKDAVWAEDAKSVVLEFAANLAAADYVVTVGGISEDDLTATVKVEAEKIAEIKFQSDKAPLTRHANPANQDYTQISVGYVVLNQYGEDISATTSLNATATKGTAVASNGTVTISVTTPAFFNINEQVHVTLLHVDGMYVNTTVTVASEARVSSVSITGLQHDEDKELTVDSNASEFALVLELKDQYGNSLKDAAFAAADTVASSSNPIVANAATIVSKNIKNENKLVLPLSGNLQAGTATISLLAITTGDRGAYDVVVKDAKKLDKLTLSAPASAPAGKEIEIPFTAIDQFGDVIEHPTNANTLSRAISGGTTADVNFKKDVVKNKTALKVQLPSQKGSTVLVIVTQTNEVVRLTLNVTDGVAPAAVGGIKDVAKSVLKDDKVTIAKGNVIIKDQYNNDYDISSLYATDDATTPTNGQYRVVVSSSNSNVKVSNTSNTVVNSVYAVYDTDSVVVTGAAKGNATVTLKLQVYNGTTATWVDVANSSYNYTQRVVVKDDIKSYVASVSGNIYATGAATPAGYEKTLKVEGVLADDSKVTIPNDAANYDVTTNNAGLAHVGGKLGVTNLTDIGIPSDKKEKELTVHVLVIGSETAIIPVKVTVSNAAPEATTLELRTHGVATKENDVTVSVALNDLTSANAIAVDAVKTKDQYGVEIATAFSNAIASKALGSLAVGDTFTIAAVTSSGKDINFTVVVK